MITEQDIKKHVIYTQMIDQGVCDNDEKEEKLDWIIQLENQPDFHDWDSKRYNISKGIAKRRNSIYRDYLRTALNKDFKRFERYVYHLLEHSQTSDQKTKIQPDPRVLTAKLKI